MWNVLFEPYGDGTPRGNDLSKLLGTSSGVLLCVYPTYWKNASDLGSRTFPTSSSAIWPSLAGPWCDKTKDPNCKPECAATRFALSPPLSRQPDVLLAPFSLLVSVPLGFPMSKDAVTQHSVQGRWLLGLSQVHQEQRGLPTGGGYGVAQGGTQDGTGRPGKFSL